jgi:hypothetical protein
MTSCLMWQRRAFDAPLEPLPEHMAELGETVRKMNTRDRVIEHGGLLAQRLVLLTALQGRAETVRTLLECLSVRNRTTLSIALKQHHLILWDAQKRIAIRF